MSNLEARKAADKRADISPPAEQWRRVRGFPDYEASDQGNVARILPDGSRRLLKPVHPESARYPMVALCRPGMKPKTFRVHKVMALAGWLGRKPRRAIVRHRDDVPTRNAAANLAWGSHRANHRDALKRGTVPGVGPELALAIRDSYAPRRGRIKELREHFGISNSSLRRILLGVSYREVTGGRRVPSYRGGR